MSKQTIISIIVAVAALGAVIFFAIEADKKPGKLDSFATCLEDQGATFWGAFWCPACQQQKALFGRKSSALLPYTECSSPDGKSTNQVCLDAEIESYPTWEFADGERQVGVVSLEALAEKTSCELPQ